MSGLALGEDNGKSDQQEQELIEGCMQKVFKRCEHSDEINTDACIARVLPEISGACHSIVDRFLRLRHFNDDKFLKEHLGGPKVSIPVELN